MALPVLHLLTVLSVFSGIFASLSDDYAHFAALDPSERIKLYWTIHQSNQSVSFALEAATTGWVGFGISSGSGMMTGADLVIGWVKDGKPVLTDRFAKGKWIPQIDEHNDYHLTYGEEKNGTTILKFHRKIDTCDKEDIRLKEGTTKVIFALNDEDPVSPMQMNRHTFRGARSILLLNSQGNRNKPDPSWSSFDIRNENYEVPSKHTTYHCSVHKIPDFPKKNHIVRFDPVVQIGNEGVVHHIVVMTCDKDFPGVHLNVSGVCAELIPNMPAEVLKCIRLGALSAAWGVGGGPFVYPEHVGFPLGDGDHLGNYFVMEVHYDNPDRKTGIIDNSGIRFFYTPNLRKYDAGVLTVGSSVSSWLMIPPQQRRWVTTTSCPKSCTEKHLKNSSLPESGIKIFSAFLHTHLSGRAIWTQHVRDGTELPEIARDDNYDFNFQDIQFLRKEVHLKPGDELVNNCVYNTMDRTNLTFGGESTRDEMCLNFMFYYPFLPKMPSVCTSLDLKAGVTMMDNHYPPEDRKNGSFHYNPIRASHVIWTPKMTDEYKQLIADEKRLLTPFCKKGVRNVALRDLLKEEYRDFKVKITTPLPAPKDGCDVYSSAVRTSGYVLYQILTITFIVLTQW